MCLPFGTPKPSCTSADKWHIYIYINVGVHKSKSSPFWSLGQLPSVLLCVSEAE